MPSRRPRAVLPSLAVAVALTACAAHAATLPVGPQRRFHLPSEAAAAAADGDTIAIDPGTYADCAVLRAAHLTVKATGPGVVLEGKVCADKGILVADAPGITVDGLTLRGASVPDGNGAGIRAEAGSITVRNSRFVDDENGILTAASSDGVVLIEDSRFEHDGACIHACAHGVYAGNVALLRVVRSQFLDTQVAHSIKSRARRTEVVGCVIADGSDGTSSYLVDIPNGGDLLLADNQMQKGLHSSQAAAAVSIGEEGVTHATASLKVRNNHFTNDMTRQTIFVRNMTVAFAHLRDNRLSGLVQALQGPGSVN